MIKYAVPDQSMYYLKLSSQKPYGDLIRKLSRGKMGHILNCLILLLKYLTVVHAQKSHGNLKRKQN